MAHALPGDTNFDRVVNIADFAVLAANFNASERWWGSGDFNFDGTVSIADFSQLAANFNRTQARPAPVPEPALGLLILPLMLRRRSKAS
jgi:hypothetical protein